MNSKVSPLAAMALAFSLMFGGCALTPKQATYKTLSAVGLSVQKSMQAAAAGHSAGKINAAGWSKISELHDTKFLPTYRTACDLAAKDLSQAAPEDLIAIQIQLITLINQLLQ